MFALLLPALLPLAIKLIGYAVEKHYLGIEQQKAFMDFILSMASHPNSSKDSRDQFAKLHIKLQGSTSAQSK